MIIDDKLHKIDVPEEIAEAPDQWVELRRLSGKKLLAARRARQEEAMDVSGMAGAMSPGEMIAQYNAQRRADAAERLEREKAGLPPAEELPEDTIDPIQRYSQVKLLQMSLRRWSWDEPIGEDPTDQMTTAAAEWLAEKIVEISGPLKEADAKNADGGYSSP